MNSKRILVVFRRWKTEDKSIFALFPEEPADYAGMYCDSYEHVSQHGGADYHGCIRASRPVSDEDAAALKRELERIGYKLKVIKRATREIHERRWAEATRLRNA